jgi:hypothetical protein
MRSPKMSVSFGVNPAIVAAIGGFLFLLGVVIPWLLSPWRVVLHCERTQELCVLTQEGLSQADRTEFSPGEITGARLDTVKTFGTSTGRQEQIVLTTNRGEIPFASYRIAARGYSSSELQTMAGKINSYVRGNIPQLDVTQDIFSSVLLISGLLIGFGLLTMILTVAGVLQGSQEGVSNNPAPW